MSSIASIFRRFVPQLLHMIVLPIFFFAFMLILRPEGVVIMFPFVWTGVKPS